MADTPARDPEIAQIAADAAARTGGGAFANSGRLNGYECRRCLAAIVTVDREPGVTPFLIGHEHKPTRGCTSPDMQSKFYRVASHLKPTHEWYRPDTFDGLSDWSKEHVRKGGLLLRPVAAKQTPVQPTKAGGELAPFGVYSGDAEATDDGLIKLQLWQTMDGGPAREFRPERAYLLNYAHAVQLLGHLALAVEKVRPADIAEASNG